MTKIDPHVDGCPSEVLARRNVELADVLVAAEQTRFRQGAGDLLALQLREQAALEARFAELSSVSDYFLALSVEACPRSFSAEPARRFGGARLRPAPARP
jgi:hypothetical protein